MNEGQFDGVGTIWIGDSFFERNYSEHDGGAVVNDGDGILIIERTLHATTRARPTGGAVYSNGGKLTIKDSTLSRNRPTTAADLQRRRRELDRPAPEDHHHGDDDRGQRSSSPGTAASASWHAGAPIQTLASGGGMANGGEGHAVLTDVLFEGNKAGDEGGGLANAGRASMALTRVTSTRTRRTAKAAARGRAASGS